MNSLPQATSHKFSLIIVNYGSAHLLAENLAKLNLGPVNGSVVVVDNYTTTAERTAVADLASDRHWDLVALDRNYGFGVGVNEGVNAAIAAGSRTVAVLNPDASISAADLQLMVHAVEADPTLMVSPLIRTSSGTIWFDGMELFMDSGEVASRRRPVMPAGPRKPWLSGACFAMSVELWNAVGGFDPDYFLYWEDVDLSHRVVNHGGHLTVLENALAVHDSGGTQTAIRGGGTKSESYYFHNIRNRLVYAAKHLEGKQLRKWIYATPRVSYQILLGGGRRQLISSPAPLRAYVKGIIYGYALMIRLRRVKASAQYSTRVAAGRDRKVPMAQAVIRGTNERTKP